MYKNDSTENEKNRLVAMADELLRGSSDKSKRDRPILNPYRVRNIKKWEVQFFLPDEFFLKGKRVDKVCTSGPYHPDLHHAI